MIPLSQTHAMKLVESISLEFQRIDQTALAHADGCEGVEAILTPLLHVIVENLDELGFLQRTLLTHDEWVEHQHVTELSTLDDDQPARKLVGSLTVLCQARSQPLVGYLLLCLGYGWTSNFEINALTDDFHEVLTSIQSRIEKLPVDVGPIKTPDGSQIYMSVALGAIWDDVMNLTSRSTRLLRKMQKEGPWTYERLSSTWGKDVSKKNRKNSVNAVRNAMKVPADLNLIRRVGRVERSLQWQLTGLGNECLAFARKAHKGR